MFLTSSKLSLALFWDTRKHFDPFGSYFHDLLGRYGALFSLKVIISHSRAKTAWLLHPIPNWSRLNNGHLRISGPNPWNLQILPYKEKMVYADVIKYFTIGKLSWIILNEWVLNPITSSLLKERGRKIWHMQKRRRHCDQGSRAWSNAATSQGIPAATRWKRQETDSPLVPLEGAWPYQHLDFGSVKLISHFWLSEVWENKLILFWPLSLWLWLGYGLSL